jgi:CDP-diacylglycerol--glycerol-3-phosphate 3-phosphatidyltransferase
MVVVLATTFLAGLGVPYVQAAGLWVLAVAATVTVVQRIAVVRRQARAAAEGRP